MTYAQYGQILVTDFNGFVSTGTPNFNGVWNTLYGQTALSTVTAYTNIGATPWASLINGIANAASHQGTTVTSVTPPVNGNIIAYISALSTNLNAISATANVYNTVGTGTDITNTGTRTTNWGVDAGAPTVTSTITVTFGSAAEAQYFFNLGGTVRVNCSRSGGAGNADDVSWSTLCTDIGTIGLPGYSTAQNIAGSSYLGLTKIGGGGTTPFIYSRTGYVGVTGTSTTLFKQYSSTTPYDPSQFIEIAYSTTATVLTITVTFTDGSTAPSGGTVTGDLSVTGVVRPPSSTGITPTWGTPTVNVTAPA